MNNSQANLYEVLDAFGVDCKAGKGVFDILTPSHLQNGVLDIQLKIKGLYLRETEKSLYAIMSIGDLGIIAKARDAALRSFCLLDFTHPIAEFYLSTKDFNALLQHLENDKWKSEFVLEVVVC